MRPAGEEAAKSALSRLLLEHPRSGNRWIGIESERFIRDSKEKILHYEPHLHPVLRKLVDTQQWKVDYEVDGKLLGLKKGFHAISLEPGGQFEVSPAPQKTIADVKNIENQIDNEVKKSFSSPDWEFFDLGYNIWEDVSEIDLLPSPRYRLMNQRFQNLKTRGAEMMRRTCGIQVNMDFASAAEGLSMLQTGFRIAPFLATMFANSPANGHLGERQIIWDDTDDARSGFLKSIFHPDFSFETYIDFLTSMPLMYAYDENEKVFDPQGKTLADLPIEVMRKNILSCTRQIFTHLRFKPCCVEVRFLDQQKDELRWAATAMSVGLIYDEQNREQISQKMKNISVEQLEKLMTEGSKKGFKANKIYTFCLDLFRMAEQGLVRRGFGEEIFLAPTEELLRISQTPAEIWLKSNDS